MPVILFDIDGTLIRTGGAGKAAMEAALTEEFGLTLAAHEVPYSGRTDVAIGRDLLVSHGIAPSTTNLRRLHNAYLDRLPAYLVHHPGQVCTGVSDLLAVLKPRADVTLGLLTGNIRRGAERKLAHFGLWDHFTCGGFGDDHDDRDDVARAALRAAADRTGRAVDPTNVWVIGDTPLDVKCARAIGAKAVAVATGWTPLAVLADTGADHVLADLSDTRELLAVWR